MTTNDLTIALISYAETHIVPQLGLPETWGQFAAGGVLALASGPIANGVARMMPTLQAMGVADEQGNIDKAKLEAFLNAGFDKQPVLKVNLLELLGVPPVPLAEKYLGKVLCFDRNDAEAFLHSLQ